MVNNRPLIRNYNYDPNHQHKPIETLRGFRHYEMFIVKQGTNKPLPLVFGEVSWSENRASLGMTLKTSLPRNLDDRHMSPYDVAEIGDKIIFKNKDHNIFTGMIEEINLDRYSKEIVCYDFGYSLNKKEVIKQFTKVNAKTAISNLCSENGIPVGKIDNMSTTITEIYNGRTISDIIKDIMEKEEEATGKYMVMEVRDEKLYVQFTDNLKISMIYKPVANVSRFDPRLTIGEISNSSSITDLKNEVIIIHEKDKKTQTVATARDNSSINKYGKRTHIESVGEDDLGRAQEIANNKLRELNDITRNITVELLGDDKVRAGRVTELNNKTFKLKGNYLIENCEHVYQNSNRFMKLDLKGV